MAYNLRMQGIKTILLQNYENSEFRCIRLIVNIDYILLNYENSEY